MTREIAGLEQEEYMYENCRDNKYFLINLDTEVRNNDLTTKIWLCRVMSEKMERQVTKSSSLNLPLQYMKDIHYKLFDKSSSGINAAGSAVTRRDKSTFNIKIISN